MEAPQYHTPENDFPNNYDSKNEYLVRSGPLGMCHGTYCLTCPIYLRATPQRNSNPLDISNYEFPNTLHGDASWKWARRICTFFTPLVPRIMNPHNKLVQQWNRSFYICCLVTIFVGPLFVFMLSVQKENMCIVMNRTVSIFVVVIRSFNDVMQLVNIVLQFRLAFVSYESWPRAARLIDNPKEIAFNYLRTYFLVDLLVVFPLPLILIHSSYYLGLIEEHGSISGLGTVIFMQYFLRLVRILPIGYSTREKSIFKNLLIVLPFGHVVGSIWYLFGLQRVNECLLNACNNISSNKTGCLAFTYCSSGGAPALWKDNENVTACLSSPSVVQYGIFLDAVPLTTETSVAKKISFSMFWGFKQIITLADNLTPSYKFLGEVYFTMAIMGLGICFFTLLVTNIQNLLQAVESRKTEMELRVRDVEQWMNRLSFPEDLIRRIRIFVRFDWPATRGVHEETILETLPEDLQTDIRRHIFKFLKKVQIFALMNESMLDAICERLKLKRYVMGSKILSERGFVEKMIFVVRGKLESVAADGTTLLMSVGDACGEELLVWYLEPASVRTDCKRLPAERLVSNRSVRCLTDVEAFTLGLADLEDVFILFSRFLQKPRVQGAIRYQLPLRRLHAAKRIQYAWRNRNRRISIQIQTIE